MSSKVGAPPAARRSQSQRVRSSTAAFHPARAAQPDSGARNVPHVVTGRLGGGRTRSATPRSSAAPPNMRVFYQREPARPTPPPQTTSPQTTEVAPRRARSSPAAGQPRQSSAPRRGAPAAAAPEPNNVVGCGAPPTRTAARRSSHMRISFAPAPTRTTLDHPIRLRRTLSEIARLSPAPPRPRPVLVVPAQQTHSHETSPTPMRQPGAAPHASATPARSSSERGGTTPLRQSSHTIITPQANTPIVRTTTAHPHSVRKHREVSVDTVGGRGWSEAPTAHTVLGPEEEANLRALSLDSTSTMPFESTNTA